MKKYRKLLAVLLTLAMMLGMSMTSMAASANEDSQDGDGGAGTTTQQDRATVTIKDAANATLTYVQVVEPDPTKATGWKFCSDDIANIFKTAFFGEQADNKTDEDAIRSLISTVSEEVYETNTDNTKVIKNANSSDDLAKALTAVAESSEVSGEAIEAAAQNASDRTFTVYTAGIYAIQGTEEGYTYNNMAAFVSFGEVTNQNYPELQDVTITAKKAPDTIEKTVSETNHVVPVGKIVTYTITTTVPNVSNTITDKTFQIIDTLDGGEYYLSAATDRDKKVDSTTGQKVDPTFTVKLGNEVLSAISADVTEGYTLTQETTTDGKNNPTFTVDLSSLINTANTNAGKTVTITYTAVVTSPDTWSG